MINFKQPTEEQLNYIKENFAYDSLTGKIERADRRNSGGSYDRDGYLILKIKTKQFKAHRIAWFLYYGTYPTQEIDHINRDRADNRISNLRLVSRSQNVRNSLTCTTPNADTGQVGIYIDKSTKGLKKVFTTRIKDKTYRFLTLQEAINFRKKYYYDC